jgi:lipopolysaccharide transport periplasmic protein LptA
MTRPRHPEILICFLALLALSGAARAEKADRDKPVFIEADSAVSDDAKKVSTFTGNAVLTQGTLVIKGDVLIMREDPEGFQYGTAHGNPAYFRQKREGLNEYVEGWGQRLEHNGKAEKLELFVNARVRRGQDESLGDYISYDQKTEFFNVRGGKEGGAPGRVRTVIMPKDKNPPAAKPKAARAMPIGNGSEATRSDATPKNTAP